MLRSANSICGCYGTCRRPSPFFPTVTAPGSFPISLGDIPANGTASVSFTVSLVGCNPNAEWEVRAPWSSSVYDTGTFTFQTDFNRGNGGH